MKLRQNHLIIYHYLTYPEKRVSLQSDFLLQLWKNFKGRHQLKHHFTPQGVRQKASLVLEPLWLTDTTNTKILFGLETQQPLLSNNMKKIAQNFLINCSVIGLK